MKLRGAAPKRCTRNTRRSWRRWLRPSPLNHRPRGRDERECLDGAGKSRLILAPLMMMTLAVCVTRGPSAARPGAAQEQKSGNSKVHVLHVQGNVYMLVEPDSNNITVQIGNQYIIVVDSGVPEYSDDVIAAIRSLSDLPIMFIANTSSDPDHIGRQCQAFPGWMDFAQCRRRRHQPGSRSAGRNHQQRQARARGRNRRACEHDGQGSQQQAGYAPMQSLMATRGRGSTATRRSSSTICPRRTPTATRWYFSVTRRC